MTKSDQQTDHTPQRPAWLEAIYAFILGPQIMMLQLLAPGWFRKKELAIPLLGALTWLGVIVYLVIQYG